MDKAKLILQLEEMSANRGAAKRAAQMDGDTMSTDEARGMSLAYYRAAQLASQLDEPAQCPLAESWRERVLTVLRGALALADTTGDWAGWNCATAVLCTLVPDLAEGIITEARRKAGGEQ